MTITASKSMATPAKTAEQLVHCTAAATAASDAAATAAATPPPSDDAVPAAPPTAAASTPPAPPTLMVSATYFQFTIKQHVPVFLHSNPPTLEQTLATARHGVGLLCLNLTYAILGTMWLLHGPYAPPDTLSCVQTGCLAAVLYGLALNVLQLSVPNVWLQLADYRKDAHRPREAKAVRRSCMLFVASLGLSCAILASVVFIMYPIVAPLDQMGASWGFVQVKGTKCRLCVVNMYVVSQFSHL